MLPSKRLGRQDGRIWNRKRLRPGKPSIGGSCEKGGKPIPQNPLMEPSNGDDANRVKLVICFIGLIRTRRRSCSSWTALMGLSTTLWLSVIFEWSKSSKRCREASAVCLGLKRFVAFVAVWPSCANKALIC